MDLDAYLKDLAQKKVTVTITKLDKEVIQLWTKSHWMQIDPYSDLEEVKSDTLSTSSTAVLDQQIGLDGAISVRGHSLRT